VPTTALVLLVEDEPLVCGLAVRLLQRSGFSVIACEDPDAALGRAELADGSVQVLLTDLSLPGMTGEQLAREVRARLPDVAVVFMSGYTDDEMAREAVRSSATVFVAKPFTGAELVDGVRQALAAGVLVAQEDAS
jgi:CheY-like chemotaxis protein